MGQSVYNSIIIMRNCMLLLVTFGMSTGDIIRPSSRRFNRRFRHGRQQEDLAAGVDFSNCVTDPDTGFCCVDKLSEVTSLQKDPILECTHKNTEQCHDKVLTSLVDVPEEICDLNPQKTCRFITKLVPKLSPKHECTIVPQEVCNLKFSTPKQVPKPLQ